MPTFLLPQTPLRRWLWLLPFGIMALVPIVIYIDASAQAWLIAMIALTLIAQAIVTLRTLSRAFSTDRLLHEMTGNLDLLILTSIGARQVVFGQWRAVIRTSTVEYLLLIPLRLGLALALAHYFHLVMPQYCDLPFGSFFCYTSYPLLPWQPFPVQIALAAVMITLFTLAELAIISALGVMVNATPLKQRALTLLASGLLRLALPLIALGVIGPWIHLQTNILIRSSFHSDIYCYDPEGRYDPVGRDDRWATLLQNYPCDQLTANLNQRRLWDTLYVAQFTLVDQGLMLTANLLRPSLGYMYRLDRLDFHYTYGGTVLMTANSQQYLDSRISAWRFLVRMLASGAIGLAVYSVLTGALLYGAYRLRLRRGFKG